VSWSIAAVVAGALTVPVALMTSGQASKQLYWIGTTLRLDEQLADSVFVLQFFGSSTVLAVVCGVLALLGVVLVLAVPRLRRWASSLEVALPAIVVPTVVVIVVSVVVQPLYNSRYLTFTAPFVAVLVGVGLAAVPWRVVSVLGLALVVALCVPEIVEQRQTEHTTGSHWRDVAAYIAEERADLPDEGGVDGVYHGPLPGHPIRTTEYVSSAYPDAFVGLRDLTLVRSAADVGELWADRLSPEARLPLTGVGRVWYVGARTSEQPTAMRDRLEARGWEEESRKRIDDFYVITFTR
jgi:mannosyltransferase